MQPGLAQSLGLAVMTNEARSLSNYNRSLGAFAVSGSGGGPDLRRQTPPPGAAHERGVAHRRRCCEIALDRGIPVWTEAPLEELLVEDGRVVGVRTVRDGSPVLVRARQGVLLASGGFAHNAEMREQYGGDQPNRRPVVDLESGRHRRGAQGGDADRREDRPDGRGLVAARRPGRAGSASPRSTRPASARARSTSTPPGSGS